jgi:HEPN domain-containing protein
MDAQDETRYRVNLAEGFLIEAREDDQLKRWRSCVDNSQLAVENAAKAALALIGPVGQTHDPGKLLRKALAENLFPPSIRNRITRLAEYAQTLGPDIHIQSDYGKQESGLTPWQIFGEQDAKKALKTAEEALQIAREVVQ